MRKASDSTMDDDMNLDDLDFSIDISGGGSS